MLSILLSLIAGVDCSSKKSEAQVQFLLQGLQSPVSPYENLTANLQTMLALFFSPLSARVMRQEFKFR